MFELTSKLLNIWSPDSDNDISSRDKDVEDLSDLLGNNLGSSFLELIDGSSIF